MLAISLFTLFAGPLLYLLMARGDGLARFVDRVIVAVLLVLLALFLVPEVIRPLGWLALLLVVLGYVLPSLLERLVHRAAATMHLVMLVVALVGLLVHEMLDGAALAVAEYQAESALGLAIVLHRFGVGLMLWLIIQPVFGSRATWLILVAMAAATCAGYAFSERLLPLAADELLVGFQAVIIGTILHSLLYRGHVPHDHGRRAA